MPKSAFYCELRVSANICQRREMRQPKRRKLSSPPSDRITNLCGACKVLSFNDKGVGGHEKEYLDGSKVLGFNNHDGVRESNPSNKWSLLDYHHHDYLPDLPRLLASAKAGCHFCNFLRTAIQKDLRERSEWGGCEVRITLHYVWHPDIRSETLGRKQQLAKPCHQQYVEYIIATEALPNDALRALIADLEIYLHNEILDTHEIFFMTKAQPGKFMKLRFMERPCLR
jgi:hypothetical protein